MANTKPLAEKKLKKESPLASTLSNLFSTNAIVLITMVTSIALNRGLGPELKGEYASLRLLFTFYMPLFLLGYPGGILYYSLREKLNIKTFYFTGLVTMFLTGILAAGIIYFFILFGLFGNILKDVEPHILYMALSITPFVFLNAYLERVLYAFKLFRPSNRRNVIAAIVVLIGSFGLWAINWLSLTNAVLVLLFSLVLNTLQNVWFISKLFPFKPVLFKSQIFFPWKYGIQSFLNQIIAKSNDKFDQIFLGFLVSSSGFGIYTAGVAVAGLASSVPGSYTNVFFTQIATLNAEKGLELYQKAMRTTLFLSFFIGLCLAVLAKPLILLLYGNAYLGAASVILFYLPGLIFQISARLSIKFYAAQGKPLKNALVYTIALLCSAPFYFWLVPKWGLIGAAISSSIGYFSAFAFSMYQLKREFPFKLTDALLPKKSDIKEFTLQGRKLMAKLR